MTVPVLLVGYGRMNRLVESLAPDYGMHVAGVIDRRLAEDPDRWPNADVAIDFSTADAVLQNVPRLAGRRTNVVIGTTGWHADEGRVRSETARHGVGVVAAPNFSIGVTLCLALAERAAELMQPLPAFGAWIHELHHAAKKDAPSGTALALRSALQARGYGHAVNIASTRVGSIPGTHTLGFDAAAETITLTHTARDRTAFARGALQAAQWIRGRQGWFTMREVLGI